MTFESIGAGAPGLYARTITAFFDNRDDAQEAVDAVRAHGIASADIDLISSSSEASGATGERVDRPYEEEGFWASLANLFMPSEDRYSYAEGLRRGGYLVTVQVHDETQYQAVADILDDEGTIDLDERSREWQAQGWQPSAMTRNLPDEALSEGNVDEPAAVRITSPSPQIDTTSATANATRAQGESAIPIAREELKIGKRAVDEGRMRIRSYVIEEPVEQDVQLREERVRVERRPVDRAVSGGTDPFRERTIELNERGEEAVVSKAARVVEEVALTKDEAYRTEKVRDTVRRTEVEVEDERRGSSDRRSATPSSTAAPGRRTGA